MFDQIYVVGACITISLPQKLNPKNPSSADTGGIFWVTIIPYQGLTGGYNCSPSIFVRQIHYTIPRIDRGLQRLDRYRAAGFGLYHTKDRQGTTT